MRVEASYICLFDGLLLITTIAWPVERVIQSLKWDFSISVRHALS